jgi:DNA-binding NarL/FixJ family response regulator
MSIRIVLADDHHMVREGLRLILERTPGIDVVGEAETGRMVLDLVERTVPDIVIMDIGMPDLDGIEATRRIKARDPKIKVIALSMFADRRYVLGMLEAGAWGYVLKGSAGTELVRAIEAVQQGRKYLVPEITDVVVESSLCPAVTVGAKTAPPLGDREREILRFVADGKTSKEIASALGISPDTVQAHRRNIMNKLDLHSVAELTKYAIRQRLTDVDQ